MLDVQHNLLPLPVDSDEGVQRVRVGHPPNQPRVLGQWDHRVAADTAGEGHIAQHHNIIAHHLTIAQRHLTIAQHHLTIAQLLLEVSLEGLLVGSQQRIDELKQLHHSLVLTEVLVTFEEEHVLAAITACGRGEGGE